MQSAFYKAFKACEEKGISVDDIMDGMAGAKEEAQLSADLKRLVSYMCEILDDEVEIHPTSPLHDRIKALEERINPKPKRCSSQLPVDTLCEITDTGGVGCLYSDGGGRFFKGGRTSETSREGSENWSMFKVLEQPHPTFCAGTHWSLPDWVEAKYFVAAPNGNIIELDSYPVKEDVIALSNHG